MPRFSSMISTQNAMCEVGDCEVHGGSSEIHGVLRPPRTAPLPNGGNFFCTSRSTATEATRSTSSSIPCSVSLVHLQP
ncbi:hypothetical protein EJB05_28332 [Eragrostis curvula]|uniref:Uncharacterized protein n=1 Tax=Eragrostis curvula TaxID=38414 RepID=A0A5J9UPX6_9POAL|nr:hypothetical protein EJB05_28332 [Eragrostis curvula]